MSGLILLVEDDADLAEAMSSAFVLRGWDVVHVQTVAAAVNAYRAEVDVLLIDFDLPDGTGLDLLARVGPAYGRRILWSGLDRNREIDGTGLRYEIDAVFTKNKAPEVIRQIEEWLA